MKFGKEYSRVYMELGVDSRLPQFPYKSAKKQLKAFVQDENGADNHQAVFLSYLEKELREIDALWLRAARHAIQSVLKPRATAALSVVGLSRNLVDMEEARKVDAWGRLSREAMRKILKKARKRLGTEAGMSGLPGAPLAFVSSRTKTELETLTQAEPTQHDCPVCLDVLFEPVAPACGHALCGKCYRSLHAPRTCPICRSPAPVSHKMPVLGAAAKVADPARHAERKAQEEVEKAEALAKRHAKKLNSMSMQAWVDPSSSTYEA